jgi:hypothetical protein
VPPDSLRRAVEMQLKGTETRLPLVTDFHDILYLSFFFYRKSVEKIHV